MKMVKVSNLYKTYGDCESKVHALNGVNLEIEHGESVAVIGSSGSGKSTLLHIIGGLDLPDSGNVEVDGINVYSQNDEQLAAYRRRKIGFVFQSYNLMPHLTVYENIILPLGLDGRDTNKEATEDLLNSLKLYEKRMSMPNQLSGGQAQRVAIARALITNPSVILADEPTGNLDSKTSAEVLTLLRLSLEKYSQTLMMITHDDKVAQFCGITVHIEDGIVFDKAVVS